MLGVQNQSRLEVIISECSEMDRNEPRAVPGQTAIGFDFGYYVPSSKVKR